MNEEEIKFKDLTEDITYFIYFYGSLIIVPLGLIFNLLNICVYLRPRFRTTMYGLLSVLMSILDSFSLAWSFIVYKYLEISDDPSLKSSFVCFNFRFVGRTVQQWPIYIQVFMTAYQFMEIKCLKNRFGFLNKKIYSFNCFNN